jgi:type IV fimbrial biogenesis protein FimT
MSRQRGVTLIELMTVLVIGAILAMVAVPSFVKIMATQRLRSAAGNLQVALLLTRSEGLKRNGNVQLAPVTASQWNAGWRIINVADGSVIAAYPAAPAVTIAGPATITYQSSGRITATASPVFKVSSDKIADVRCVSVNVTGMATIASSGC